MSDEVTNKVCLVTGASRGIGRAIALALGRDGYTVVGTATTADGSRKIGHALEAADVGGRGAVLDVADVDSITDVVDSTTKDIGHISVLINNAGITRDNLLLRMKENEWDEVIETDLKSVYRLSKACLRNMTKARYGRIINITSVVGAIGNSGQSNYAAAKAGVVGFTQSLAREVASRNITVNAVAPGFIQTDMTATLPDEQRTRLLASIPLARLGQPEDIAAAVSFLASKDAAYITGQVLHVNGGMYLSS